MWGMLTLFAAGEADAAEFKARIKQMHRAAVPEALSWAPVRMRSSQACGILHLDVGKRKEDGYLHEIVGENAAETCE